EGKASTVFCSLAAECRTCLGTRRVACPACSRGLSEKTKKQRTDTEAWLAAMAKVDETVDAKPMHAESAHFRITFDIKGIDDKAGASVHGGMHIYLDRMEVLYADFLRDLSATDKDFFDKTHVMLWQKVAQQERASVAYTRQSSSTESKLMGASPV